VEGAETRNARLSRDRLIAATAVGRMVRPNRLRRWTCRCNVLWLTRLGSAVVRLTRIPSRLV